MSVNNPILHLLISCICFLMYYFQLNSQPLASKGNDLIDYINKTDSLGNKQGKWIIYFDSTWNEVKSDENPFYYRLIEFKDNKPQGLVQDFWISGEKQWEGFLISSNPDTLTGKSTFYYKNGSKRSEGNYEYGIKIGYCDYFHEDGTIDSLTSILDYAERLFNDGKNDVAEKFYINAISISQRLYPIDKYPEGHPDLAKSLNNLAYLYQDQGRLSKAAPLYLEALEMTKKLYPKDRYPEGHPDLATSLNNLANLYHDQGRLSKAEPLYLEALEMRKKLYPRDRYPDGHPDLAGSLSSLAYLYQAQGSLDKAETLLLEALEMSKKLYPKDKYPDGHPDLARSLNNLASLYQDQGNLSKSEPLYKEALEITKRLYPTEKYPDGHPDLATLLNNLANLYQAQGSLNKAEPLYLEVLEMRKKLYPKDRYPDGHPDLAMSLNNLASLYIEQGSLSKAEPLYLEALEMRKKLYPKDRYLDGHPDLAMSLNNLASLYQAQGSLSKAEPLYQETLEITKKLYPKDRDPDGHPDLAGSLNNLANLYQAQGSLSKAEPLYLEALEMRKKLYPKDRYPDGHPDLAGSLNNLGYLYKSQGSLNKAEPLYQEALEIYKKLYPKERYPEGHPHLAISLISLASLYQAQGSLSKAEPLYLEALEINKKLYPKEKYPEGHPDLALSINNFALFYIDIGKYTDAEPYYKEALTLYLNFYEQNQLSMSEKEKEQFWSTIGYNFQAFNSYVLKRIEENPAITEQALNNVLFTKAMLLNSTINVKQRIMKSGNKEAISIYQNWISTRELLNKLYSLTIDEQKKSGYNIDSLENASNELEKKLNLLSTDFAKASDRKQYTFNDLKSNLKENETAIEIIRFNYFDKRWTDTVYYIALIVNKETKDYPKLVLLDNGNEIENELFAKYKSDIASPKGIYLDYKTTLKEIYTKIWKPIKDALPNNTETIYLSVDGIYNKINLNSLINPETGNYLLSESDIRIVTSTRDIAENRKSREERKTSKTAALFGFPKYDLDSTRYNVLAVNYQRDIDENLYGSTLDSIRAGQWDQLPGTKYEIEMIDSLLKKEKWKTKKYLGEEALEEAVKSLESPSILHIATHGYFLSSEEIERRYNEGRLSPRMFGMESYRAYRDPLLRSGLLMAGAKSGMEEESIINRNRDNGILTAKEVMNLNLDNTDLVVLSACETGLG
ncbi:MAG: tetratricopeptide repeat protein, partial [Candidatus Kapabacteria bacterium]|nr:tetratricopeptide repeat protein [Candidatus Kapabacteria bacterium]